MSFPSDRYFLFLKPHGGKYQYRSFVGYFQGELAAGVSADTYRGALYGNTHIGQRDSVLVRHFSMDLNFQDRRCCNGFPVGLTQHHNCFFNNGIC